MTITLPIIIGILMGWFLPRLMGTECYGVPVDIGVAAASGLLGGLISKMVVGGWVSMIIASALFAGASLIAMRQVKKVRDQRQQAVLLASRAASRRVRQSATGR